MKKYKLAAVAVDSLECSTVGRYVIISKMSFVSSKIYLGLKVNFLKMQFKIKFLMLKIQNYF